MTAARTAAKKTIRQYRDFFETVTPETLNGVTAFVSEEIRFIDPFSDVTGTDAYIRVFEKMYEDVEDPKFAILEEAWGEDVCFLKWLMTCHIRRVGDWSVEGMTELRFDDDAKIILHRDYWDAGASIYAKIPVVGWVIGLVRRRLAVT